MATSLRARISRRVRRRTQRDPQGSRHRVPRVGSDDQLPDRRGRDGRGAGDRASAATPSASMPSAGRQDGGRCRRPGDRTARRTHDRTHPARSQRGAHRRIRDRLRDPQPHLDLQVHRHDSAGRGLPPGTGAAGRRRRTRASPGRRTGPPDRRAGCGEPGMEARPGRHRDIAGTASWTPTTPSATRSLPACCATRWQRVTLAAQTTARRPSATRCPSSSAWTSRADDSPR